MSCCLSIAMARPLDPDLFRIDDGAPVLLGSLCSACEQAFFPRRRLCAICAGAVQPVDLPSEGELYSWTVVHVPFFGTREVDKSGGGYGVGQVDLPGAVRIQSILRGTPDDWQIGSKMRIVLEEFEEDPDGDAIFRFAAAEGVLAGA